MDRRGVGRNLDVLAWLLLGRPATPPARRKRRVPPCEEFREIAARERPPRPRGEDDRNRRFLEWARKERDRLGLDAEAEDDATAGGRCWRNDRLICPYPGALVVARTHCRG
jgi:hypothetical protein